MDCEVSTGYCSSTKFRKNTLINNHVHTSSPVGETQSESQSCHIGESSDLSVPLQWADLGVKS